MQAPEGSRALPDSANINTLQQCSATLHAGRAPPTKNEKPDKQFLLEKIKADCRCIYEGYQHPSQLHPRLRRWQLPLLATCRNCPCSLHVVCEGSWRVFGAEGRYAIRV
jgi:hypothetical protein